MTTREHDMRILRKLVQMKRAEHVSDDFTDQMQLHQARRDLKAMAQEPYSSRQTDLVAMLARNVLKTRDADTRRRAQTYIYSWWSTYRGL